MAKSPVPEGEVKNSRRTPSAYAQDAAPIQRPLFATGRNDKPDMGVAARVSASSRRAKYPAAGGAPSNFARNPGLRSD
jgi:hypothetical protein